jgi:GMP synthase (glutamine-hydrolysing)
MVRVRRHLLVIEHEADAPVSLFGEWLTAAGIDLDVVRPWRGDSVPRRVGADGLVVLGGAMSANDDDVAAWLPDVRSLLQAAVPAGVPTLGICLGAQLMAVAAGGRVERGDGGPELGVCPLALTTAAASDRLFGALRPPVVATQWHLDAITVPPTGAVVLASSDQYDVQAFRLGDRAWGVQFHPEVNGAVVRGWAAAEHADTFAPGRLAQVVTEVAGAEKVLEATWRPVAGRFARIVAEIDR